MNIILNRGSWLDLEYDVKDFLYFKIKNEKFIKNKKEPVEINI